MNFFKSIRNFETMINNSKEYIVCAAYKTNKDTPYLKYFTNRGFDLNNA